MSNVFNASFDELLKQAGVGVTSEETKSEPQTETKQPEPVEQEPQKEPEQVETPKANGVPSFDDLLTQAGIVSLDTPNAPTEEPDKQPERTPEADITEEYRVDTDIFGENDVPKGQPVKEAEVVSFDELIEDLPKPTDSTPEEPKTKQTEVTPEKQSEDQPAPEVKPETAPKSKTTKKTKQTKKESKQPKAESNTPSENLLDEVTVSEIKAEVRNVVRDAVREAFKEAISDLVSSFK